MRHAIRILTGTVLALGAAAQARAAEDRVSARLTWQVDGGIADCVSQSEFTALAAERMGRSLFAEQGKVDAFVTVRVVRSESGLMSLVELSDGAGNPIGRRELLGEGPSCRDLVDHTILVVGLMLDYAASRPAPAPEKARIRVPETPRQAPWRFRFGAVGEYGVGLLPQASPGVGLDLSVITPLTWSLEISAFVFADSAIPNTDQVVSTRALRLAICPLVFEPDWLRAELCLAQQTALLQANDRGFPPGRRQQHLSVAMGPRLRLDAAPFSPLFMGLVVGGEIPLSRVVFNDISLSGAPIEVYEAAAVFAYGAAVVGVEVP